MICKETVVFVATESPLFKAIDAANRHLLTIYPFNLLPNLD